MVDALRRAHRVLRPRGMLLDIHPAATEARVEVDGLAVGRVETADGPQRHAAADAALAAIVAEGLVRLERAVEFDFFTYGDSIGELRDYVADEWCHAQIRGDVVERARLALRSAPGARPRLKERVKAARYAVRMIDNARGTQ